jgi:two-component system response regulator YesN
LYKLLVVDDEDIIRDGIANVVPWDSCNIVIAGEASNGVEALEKVEEIMPDIVITDINMNCMDGLELAYELKQRHPHIKVIILSGYDEFEYAKKALQLKVFSYLLKPISPSELIKVVEDTILEIQADEKLKARVLELESELRHNKDTNEFNCSQEDMDQECPNIRSVIAKAKKYIEENFSDPNISLNTIARHFYLNPAYFSKLFKKETGMTFMEFLTLSRIEKTKYLLRETNSKVSDIGAAVGYPNPQYFVTLFRKVTGRTPIEYREGKLFSNKPNTADKLYRE